MAEDSFDGALDEAELVSGAASAATIEMPEDFRFLDEQERVQGLNLRKLFAEQEHRLCQKYADWIIWLLGAQFVIADLVFVAFAWGGGVGT